MATEHSEWSLPLPRRLWWPWDQPAARVGFKRRFDVRHAALGTLYISASGEYQVWLDGRPIQPPDAHAPSWRIIHRIPIRLAAGEHRLALEAMPGPHGQPFVLACLDWDDGDGPTRIATDASWHMAADPPANWPTGRSDEFRQTPQWREAWAFDGVWGEPWGMPCNVPDDFCRFTHGYQVVTSQALTCAVHEHAGLKAAGAAVTARPDGLIALRPPIPHAAAPFPLGDVRAQDLAYRSREAHSQILNRRLELFEARCPHIVLDAGAETFGRVRITMRSGGPAILAVTTGESVPELHHHNGRVTDVFQLEDGSSFTTGPTGFRYVKIMALSAASEGVEAVLDRPEVQHIRYPIEPVGTFSCSDERLTEIWKLSARTAHLCMQNEIWDGIKRDQLPWMGDLYTEALAIYHAFGDTRLARWSLGVLGELGPVPDRPLAKQRSPGLQSMWKQTNTDINGIPSYTMWWLVGLADYYLYSGDISLIEDLAPELEATLDHISDAVDAQGWWRHRHGWDYVDWSPLTGTERSLFCHLLACQALGLGAELLSAVGRDGKRHRETCQELIDTARHAIWKQGKASLGYAHHLPAMLIRCGALKPMEAQQVFAETLRHDRPWSMTFWHRYADLDAAWRVGEIQWGLDYVRRHWGAALDLEMTALWEAFDPTWIGPDPHSVSMVGAEYARYGGYETSLCHGWSAGPAVWLHRAVLGVMPMQPGFAAIAFRPNLGDLEWAEGTIPSPRGPVRVRLEQEDDQIRVELSTPAGMEVDQAPMSRQPNGVHGFVQHEGL